MELNNKIRTNQRCLYEVVFHPPPSLPPSCLPSSFLPLVLSKHADQVRCGISKSKNPLNINMACVCFFFLIFLLSFDSFLFCLETYWEACIARQSCDELLIGDSFIEAPCCTRTWHFLTLNLQRTDTNALMSFKLVYKLERVGGPRAVKNTTSRYWQTWPESIYECGEESVSVCMTVFGFAWGNVHQTLKNVWRTQPFLSRHREREQTVPRMPGENTVQIVWGQREQIREKAVCSSGLQGNSSPGSQVRELKEKQTWGTNLLSFVQ